MKLALMSILRFRKTGRAHRRQGRIEQRMNKSGALLAENPVYNGPYGAQAPCNLII